MSNRDGPFSLFLVTRTLVARLDLDLGTGHRLHAETQSAGDGGLVDALQRLLAGGPVPAPRGALLWEGGHAQTLDLPAVLCDGLEPDELARAVAVELEPRSGIPALAALVAMRPLGVSVDGRRRVWVLLLPRAEVEAVQNALREAGVELEWIAHPAGLLGAEGGPRVEVWSQTTWCGGGELPLEVIGAPAGKRRWKRAMSLWLERVPPGEIAFHGSNEALRECADERLREGGALPTDGALAIWLETIAARHAVEPQVPALMLARAPAERTPVRATSSTPYLAAAALTLIVLLFCLGDYRSLNAGANKEPSRAAQETSASGESKATSLQLRPAPLELPQSPAVGLGQAARGDSSPSRQGLSGLERAERGLALERGRWSGLLDAVARRKHEMVVVTRIHWEESGAFSIKGTGEQPESASAFAAALEAELAGRGWAVGPAQCAFETLPSGVQLCSFDIKLSPKSVPGGTVR